MCAQAWREEEGHARKADAERDQEHHQEGRHRCAREQPQPSAQLRTLDMASA
jgi:hypothetical protein